MTGFYYHTEEFEAAEVIRKCIKRLDQIPTETDSTHIDIRFREETSPSEIFDSNFAEDWIAPNYTDSGATYDVPISDLNEESKTKEAERLAESKGQFFAVEANVIVDGDTFTVSALVEIRGRAGDDKTEFYIEEYQLGAAGVE